MTQIGTVTAVEGPERAWVAVARQSACAHECASCAGCGAQAGSVTVLAAAALEVAVGDKVELHSGSGQVLSIAAAVYLAPVVLFLAGYLLSGTLPEGARYLCGGLGFALGLLGAVWLDRRLRRRGAVTYRIVRKV